MLLAYYRAMQAATVVGGGGGSLMLDSVAVNPLLALSTRKLRTAYAGSAIRVRRTSDNAEQDIGFVSGELDTASLLSFCGGGGEGHVSKWYNQASGATFDVAQATAADQPFIVYAGSVLTFPGTTKPSVDISNFGLQVGVNLGGTTNLAFSGVVDVSDSRNGNGAHILSFIGDSSGANDYSSAKNFTLGLSSAPSGGSVTWSIIRNLNQQQAGSGVHHQFAMYCDGTNQNLGLYFDGSTTPLISTANAQGAFDTTGQLYIGYDNFAQPTYGYFGELVLQTSFSSSDVAAFASNQKTYWGTP